MRDFTDTEQRAVRKLIEWSTNGQSIRLGEVLRNLFPEIEYIKPSKNKKEEFYKHTIDICYNEKQCSLSDILEVVNLFDLLVKQNYIVVKQLFPIERIGEEHQGMYPIMENQHYVETPIVNYYQYDLWEFLCNHFYVTNALVDFAKDFKTPEQRRHNCTTNISVAAIIVSVIIGITSPYISKCISEKSDKESLEQVVSAIKEQKSISIDKFPDIIPDTLNIRVTDASDKQPINLNVTVKENQSIKVQ
ncbi:MAG: hypothetical protein U0L53_08815 [Bacteroidales bacterium]|jgi:hypothetical protein|nr:hypothetical protein [Bacteroidales bacterium]